VGIIHKPLAAQPRLQPPQGCIQVDGAPHRGLAREQKPQQAQIEFQVGHQLPLKPTAQTVLLIQAWAAASC
jgi:hypothetical protein